jgi:hypothetical protein
MPSGYPASGPQLPKCARFDCTHSVQDIRRKYCSSQCFSKAKVGKAGTAFGKVNAQRKAEKALPFNRPYAKTIQPKPVPSDEPGFWAKYAIGPRDGAGLNAEAWRRHPGTDCGNVRLKMWTS